MASDPSDSQQDAGGGDFIKGQVRHQQVSALVPESVGRGVFSTGAIVLVGANEFILDFVVRMAQPHQVAARVVLPHAVMPQLINALTTNLDRYSKRFGDPPAMPKNDPSARRPSIEEVYDDLRIPDDDLAGAYANAVMISHSPAEFCFDFITNFFPRSSVSCRVFLSAAQAPRLLDAINHTYQEFQKRVTMQRQTRLSPPTGSNAVSPSTPRDESSPYYPPKKLSSDDANEQIIGPHMPAGDDPDNSHMAGPGESNADSEPDSPDDTDTGKDTDTDADDRDPDQPPRPGQSN